jgi:hypothetical protein
MAGKRPGDGSLTSFRRHPDQAQNGGMRTEQPPSRHLWGADANDSLSPDPRRPGPDHQLVDILAELLDVRGPTLPPWSMRRWAISITYPDIEERPHKITVALGRQRDELLANGEVVALMRWAAGRRPPALALTAAAAALATVGEAQAAGGTDARELAPRVVAAVNGARPIRNTSHRRDLLLEDPDRVAATHEEPAPDNPRVRQAVHALLRLARSELSDPLAVRVEVAVDQSCRWWLEHTKVIPQSLNGLGLPGIVPAGELRNTARLSALVPDPVLRTLVAGRIPGRKRSCQSAWREGLTFWTAAWLTAEQQGRCIRPPDEVIRCWRTQLAHLAADAPDAALAAGPAIASG